MTMQVVDKVTMSFSLSNVKGKDHVKIGQLSLHNTCKISLVTA